MAVNLSPVGGVAAQFFDNNGVILTGGKIYTYAAGTSTPQATYTSSNGATAHSNPIILDASGRVPSGEIWLTDGLQYKFVIKDSTDVLIGTYDNVIGINSNFVNFTSQQEIQTATANQTVFTLTTMEYQPSTNNLSVFVDGVNQYGPGAQYAYIETSETVVTFVNGLHVGALVKFTTAQINSASYGNAFQISYTPPYVNSVATNVGDKLAESISVTDFGAVGNGVANNTTAFENAFTESQVNGIQLGIPSGEFVITDSSAFPDQTNNIVPINIITSASTKITGDQTPAVWADIPCFGHAKGNTYNLINYNYRYSAPSLAIEDPGAAGVYPFGMATDIVECVPEVTFRGNADAAFYHIVGKSGLTAQIGSINMLTRLESGFLGDGNGTEIDIDNYAVNRKGLGAVITGVGDKICEAGVKITRGNTTSNWFYGIQVARSKYGLYIDLVDEPSPINGLFIGGMNKDQIKITPKTDANPTDAVFFVTNSSDSLTNFRITKQGSVLASGFVKAAGNITGSNSDLGVEIGALSATISDATNCFVAQDNNAYGTFTDLIVQARTSAGNAGDIKFRTGDTTSANRFTVKKLGSCRFVPLAAAPASPEAGDVYFDSSLNKLRCYNGSAWQNLF